MFGADCHFTSRKPVAPGITYIRGKTTIRTLAAGDLAPWELRSPVVSRNVPLPGKPHPRFSHHWIGSVTRIGPQCLTTHPLDFKLEADPRSARPCLKADSCSETDSTHSLQSCTYFSSVVNQTSISRGAHSDPQSFLVLAGETKPCVSCCARFHHACARPFFLRPAFKPTWVPYGRHSGWLRVKRCRVQATYSFWLDAQFPAQSHAVPSALHVPTYKKETPPNVSVTLHLSRT